MSQIRNRLSLSVLLAALAGEHSLDPARNLIHVRSIPAPAKRQATKKTRWGNSVPHQGKRECARRRGGQDWANFRTADRAWRGLSI